MENSNNRGNSRQEGRDPNDQWRSKNAGSDESRNVQGRDPEDSEERRHRESDHADDMRHSRGTDDTTEGNTIRRNARGTDSESHRDVVDNEE